MTTDSILHILNFVSPVSYIYKTSPGTRLRVVQLFPLLSLLFGGGGGGGGLKDWKRKAMFHMIVIDRNSLLWVRT